MQLADLMEKSEAGQFVLLSYLQQHQTSTIKEAVEATGFSRATLLKYLTLLQDKMQDGGLAVDLGVEGEKLFLHLDPAIKGREIRQLFLKDAVRYQLLCHLLYQQQLLAHQLAQELLISEATLNRHLSSLNTILVEFGISIQNGKLKGAEHQIRYFYFCLFRKVWSSQIWQAELKKVERIREFAVLEELCGAPLTQGQQLDLSLWCHISQQRLRTKGCQFTELERLLHPYFDSIFYQRLLRVTPSLFAGQHLVFAGDDSEMMLLFAFLFTHRILPVHTVEYMLGFGGPLAERTTQLIQLLKTQGLIGDYLDGQVTVELSQLCGQAYLFKGYILQDDYKYDSRRRQPYLISEQDFRQIVAGICQQFPSFQQHTDLDRKIRWELLQVLDYIAENEGKNKVLDLR